MAKSLTLSKIAITSNLLIILFISTSETVTFDFKEVIKLNKEEGHRMGDKCSRRVYGGNRANSKDLPYQVTIRRAFDGGRQWWSICAGSIITHAHVLTAAHCFADVSSKKGLQDYKVIASTTRSNVLLYGNKEQRQSLLKELVRNVETWVDIAYCHKHVKYRKEVEDINNIAVLQLAKNFTFSDTIKPIRMVTDDTFFTAKLDPGTLCLVSGYGAYEMFAMSTFLKMACIPIVSFDKCKMSFYRTLRSNITQVCAGMTEDVTRKVRKSTCTGDAGGPLVCHGLLVGMVSYLQGNCYSTPGIYALLSGYTIDPVSPFQKLNLKEGVPTDHSVKINCNVYQIVLSVINIYYIVNVDVML